MLTIFNFATMSDPFYVIHYEFLILKASVIERRYLHRDCNKNNATGVTCGAGTAYPSELTEHLSSPQGFSEVCVARS
jgi:hypothetical protein